MISKRYEYANNPYITDTSIPELSDVFGCQQSVRVVYESVFVDPRVLLAKL